MLAALMDDCRVFVMIRLFQFRFQQIGETQDAIQGGAQLVRYGCKEG